jgi:diguanylate cyclase (GGDEF)-like protein
MRHFGQVIERELERARRSGQPLSLLVCDLDYLRNINNTYGHASGERPDGVDLIVSKPVSFAALQQAVAAVVSN